MTRANACSLVAKGDREARGARIAIQGSHMIRRRAPAIVFATRSGGTTINRDAFGGNPFATALIQLAGRSHCRFGSSRGGCGH